MDPQGNLLDRLGAGDAGDLCGVAVMSVVVAVSVAAWWTDFQD